ncbi:MAG TPA: extracellular solute-binding protein, partial [Erysipelotrichaceae bacterium]|nr:extracellular solute-binding protein [Erysipelotrichaceae bacterium]
FFVSLNIETSLITLLIAHITFCIPFVILSIMPKLRTLDDNVAEAALDLGATPFQALTKVIIPQIKPAILSGALIAFSMSFDDFVISFFTTGTGVSNISIYVYSMSKRINPTINALSSLIVVVVTTVLIVANVIPLIRARRPQTEVVKKKSKYSFVPYLAAALAFTVFLVSFGSRTTGEFDPIAEFGSNTLNIFNYGEYVGEDVIAEFEDMYNVKVNYDTFASNEEMYTKLMSGASYDVIIASDYMIQKIIKDGMVQKLDKDVLTNLTDLYADALKYMEFDSEMLYAVPYLWGNVGIIYDSTLVDAEDVESLGWDVFLLEKYRGMVYFYDSERDSFMVALKALGYSMNTKNEQELLEAYNWLIKMDNAVDPAYVTDEIIDGIINGEKALGYVYSGDATYMIYENENLSFYVPHQGTNIWMDCMIIPSNAKSPDLANFFINYMLSYDVSYANSEYVGYTSPNEEVLIALS